jgi:hypothetical protein
MKIAQLKEMITIEKNVINPNPLPVLPNICCSIGASLNTIANTSWAKNRDESIMNILTNLKSHFIFVFANRYGSINIVEQSKITTLGIISASLLKFGVATKVITTVEAIIKLYIDIFLVKNIVIS